MWKATVKWNGKEFGLEMDSEQKLLDVKLCLEKLTNVRRSNIKLLGLKSPSGAPNDSTRLGDIVVNSSRVIMMGTPDTEKLVEMEDDSVEDDLDVNASDSELLDAYVRPENLAKVQNRIDTVPIELLNAPREGKKCLVLDIDHTLFDLHGSGENPLQLARPFLQHFLTSVSLCAFRSC